eukprot:g31028.t1
MTGLYCVVVNVILRAANNGLFNVWQLFEGEKWRLGEDLGKVLIVIKNVLKTVKNMAQFLCFWEVLDNKGQPIRRILCLSSEEVITVSRCGTLELTIDELSIVSCSHGGVLQLFQVSSFLLIRSDSVY